MIQGYGSGDPPPVHMAKKKMVRSRSSIHFRILKFPSSWSSPEFCHQPLGIVFRLGDPLEAPGTEGTWLSWLSLAGRPASAAAVEALGALCSAPRGGGEARGAHEVSGFDAETWEFHGISRVISWDFMVILWWSILRIIIVANKYNCHGNHVCKMNTMCCENWHRLLWILQ